MEYEYKYKLKKEKNVISCSELRQVPETEMGGALCLENQAHHFSISLSLFTLTFSISPYFLPTLLFPFISFHTHFYPHTHFPIHLSSLSLELCAWFPLTFIVSILGKDAIHYYLIHNLLVHFAVPVHSIPWQTISCRKCWFRNLLEYYFNFSLWILYTILDYCPFYS